MPKVMMALMMGGTEPTAPLKKQSRHKTWQPGEIPAGTMFVSRPHDVEHAPYGHGHLGVECPVKRSAFLHGTVGAEKSADTE